MFLAHTSESDGEDNDEYLAAYTNLETEDYREQFHAQIDLIIATYFPQIDRGRHHRQPKRRGFDHAGERDQRGAGRGLDLHVHADRGASVEDVIVDGVSVGPMSSYTFTSATEAHALHVEFSAGSWRHSKRSRPLYRDPAGRQIKPDAAKLSSKHGGGHHLVRTRAGDLDVLRASSTFDYRKLLPASQLLEVEGVAVRFASLGDVINMKALADRPKDRVALPVLRAVLEETDGEDG